MTTAAAIRQPAPGEIRVSEFEGRLAYIAKLIGEATDEAGLRAAHDAARMVERAAAILRHRDIQTRSAALVMDAERAMAKTTPAQTPAEAGKNGGRGNKRVNDDANPFPPLPAYTLARFRSAHSGLPDEQYQQIREASIQSETPLTRDTLIAAARKARLADADPDATRLGAMGWEGGKSVAGTRGVGQWVMSLLPYDNSRTGLYIEPFAGMCSVLLNRPRTNREFTNDINRRIQNFWACLRRWPDEFARQIELTPYSEAEFQDSLASLDVGPPLERARKFVVVVGQGIIHSDRPVNHWAVLAKNPQQVWPMPRRIHNLAERMRGVHLACRPAEHFIERFEKCPLAVMYLDPPYPQVSRILYKDSAIDQERIAASLNRQQGRCLVSGNPGDWDEYLQSPGWTTLSKKAYRSTTTVTPEGLVTQDIKEREEIAWVNYDPETGRRLPQ